MNLNPSRTLGFFWGYLLYLSFGSYLGVAQENPADSLAIPNQQLELRHDNDFLLTTDKHYSSGLFLTYRRKLKNRLFSAKDEQLTLSLKQQVYTPSNTESIELTDYDRPYAAFTGLQFGWATTSDRWYLGIDGMLGQAGPDSGAGDFQRWYHNAIVISPPPVWEGEIANSFHSNMYLKTVREWEWIPNPFGIRAAIELKGAAGTKDIYIEPGIALHFGRRNPMNQSIAYHQLGSLKREIYFTLRMSQRFVQRNALIEGHPSGDASPLTFSPEKQVFHIGFDFYHRFNRHDYKISYRYLGPEVPDNGNHNYLILSYAYSFGS
ncbi:MAG: DUF2219 family protein [Eudoraea sp.]|nr:DUF2219 family protein [Eudoraea sp.]